MSRRGMRILLLACALICTLANAAVSVDDLDPAQRDRYHGLVQEFRCVVCQNRSIAESDAPLAADLRNIVARQIKEGRSDRHIKAYLVSRYGDWILYDPPFKWSTWLLWLGPFGLLGIGLALIVSLVRRRRGDVASSTPPRVSASDRDRLKALLDEDPEARVRR